jgi:Mor family transcriptional regulator
MPKIDDSFTFTIRSAVAKEVKDIKSESLERIVDNIASVYGGGMVYVSMNYHNSISVRNSKIIDDHKSGESIKNISTKFLLSERQVLRIIRKT